MTTRATAPRNFAAAFAAVAMVLAGCSDDPTSGPVAAEEVTSDITRPAAEGDSASADADATTDPRTSDAGELEAVTIDGADGPTNAYVSSAMGGVRFAAPEASAVLVSGDAILVTPDANPLGAEGFPLAPISLTPMLGSGAPLESAAQYLDAIRSAGVEVTATDTTIDVLGYELIGYEMVSSDNDLFLFAADRIGAPVQSGFGPQGNTIEFIADTPSGVLTATVADPDASPESLLPMLGTLLESLELTGPGLDGPLPPGESIEFADGGPPPPAAEASDDPDALPPLGEPFTAIEAGRDELLNLGMPLSVEVPDDWFLQPNFPGVVVLTKEGSIGPGDRDLVWINDIREFAPIAGGPIRAGDARPVDDIEAILSDPPAGLVIDEVERFDLDGPNGDVTPIVSFRVSVDPSSACSPTKPCDYAFIISYGFVKPMLSTSAQRVWFFPEHPSGSAAAVAQSNLNSDFLAEAEAVMATLELRR